MHTIAGAGCRSKGKLSTLCSWDGITGFLVSSDLVIYFNAGLDEFVKYIGECNLVRENVFEFAIEALLKKQDPSTFIEA